MGGAGGGHDLGAAGVRLAVGDVLRDGAEEQEGLLQHQPDVAPVVGHGEAADVGAVDLDRALGGVVEAADQVDQRALARAAVAHQADHLAGLDAQVEVVDDGARAVAEAQPAHRDRALHPLHLHRVRGFGHVAHVVEDVEDALGAGRGLLRHRDDAAHRVHAGVEAADVGDEGGQHAHRDAATRHLPDAEAPDHQQADLGQQRHRGREHRPGAVELVVDLQVVGVGGAEALGLAALLREGLDHADAGDGVGQHVGDLGPDAVDLLEAGAQPVAHHVDHPGDEGQRHQRDHGQQRIDRDQDRRRHDDHQHVVGEIERMQRQEDVDAVGFGADARHQVAGALAAEVVERQGQQVFVGGGAQVRADALGHQRQQVGARPAQAPADQRRAEQAAQVEAHAHRIDLLPVLERNQDVVHQRDREVRRHQGGGRGQHGEEEAGDQLLAVGPGEAAQPQQHPGRGRGLELGVDLVGLGLGCRARDTAGMAGTLAEQPQQAQRGDLAGQGVAPARQPALAAHQVEQADPRLVAQLQRQRRVGERPLTPDAFAAGLQRQQPLVGECHQAKTETKFFIEVNRQCCQNVFRDCEPAFQSL
ncbi:MAG: hypothetical protein GAK39_05778 [Variovorax sp.]|nr:MAG: hypothetical protein GAK39_05778 [Variovorax sp.]